MKMRLALVMLGCAALVAGAVSVACNGDNDETSAEEYFEKLEEIDDRFQEESDALNRRGDELDDADVRGARDLFEELIDLFEDFVNELEDLDAPDIASDAHDDAVENYREAIDDFRQAIEDADDADSVEEFVEDIFGAIESDASEAATDACLSLEEIAADHEITVDLDCEE